VYKIDFRQKPTIVKERFGKQYRHPDLDRKLTKQRQAPEVKCLERVRKAGVATPQVYHVDNEQYRLYMEFIDGLTTRDYIFSLDLQREADQKRAAELADAMGRAIGTVHASGVVHGDLTTSNMMLRRPDKGSFEDTPASQLQLVMIDFGLAFISPSVENRAVDLYVLEKAFLSTHPKSEEMFQRVLVAYESAKSSKLDTKKVLEHLEEVRKRGRKRDMTG